MEGMEEAGKVGSPEEMGEAFQERIILEPTVIVVGLSATLSWLSNSCRQTRGPWLDGRLCWALIGGN